MDKKRAYVIMEKIDRRVETAFKLADDAEELYWDTDDLDQWRRCVYFCQEAYGL